jgi:hypothetical protein
MQQIQAFPKSGQASQDEIQSIDKRSVVVSTSLWQIANQSEVF